MEWLVLNKPIMDVLCLHYCSMEACDSVHSALDSRSKGLRFDSHCGLSVEVMIYLCVYAAFAHPSVISTWWNEKKP